MKSVTNLLSNDVLSNFVAKHVLFIYVHSLQRSMFHLYVQNSTYYYHHIIIIIITIIIIIIIYTSKTFLH